ncbi:MAG TPA: hypothetical protein VF283_21900 [Bryobacteraceae bacterium]
MKTTRMIAELVRRAVRDTPPRDRGGAWMRFAGFVESGDPKSSQSVDEVVYDGPTEPRP